MITKAVVEQIIDKYQIRVRIPKIDRSADSARHTKTEDLNIALVCTLPGCDPNIQVGDIVYVALDDKNEDEAVILGYLYRSKVSSTVCNMILNDLDVKIRATLPEETNIGKVNCSEIEKLSGIKDNIQSQIDHLTQRLFDVERLLCYYDVTVCHLYFNSVQDIEDGNLLIDKTEVHSCRFNEYFVAEPITEIDGVEYICRTPENKRSIVVGKDSNSIFIEYYKE